MRRLGERASVLLSVLAALSLAVGCAGRTPATAGEAITRVREGMRLAEVEQKLADAWRHQYCPYGDEAAEHFFFYGTIGNTDASTAVAVRVEGPRGEEVVTRAGTLGDEIIHLATNCGDAEPWTPVVVR